MKKIILSILLFAFCFAGTYYDPFLGQLVLEPTGFQKNTDGSVSIGTGTNKVTVDDDGTISAYAFKVPDSSTLSALSTGATVYSYNGVIYDRVFYTGDYCAGRSVDRLDGVAYKIIQYDFEGADLADGYFTSDTCGAAFWTKSEAGVAAGTFKEGLALNDLLVTLYNSEASKYLQLLFNKAVTNYDPDNTTQISYSVTLKLPTTSVTGGTNTATAEQAIIRVEDVNSIFAYRLSVFVYRTYSTGAYNSAAVVAYDYNGGSVETGTKACTVPVGQDTTIKFVFYLSGDVLSRKWEVYVDGVNVADEDDTDMDVLPLFATWATPRLNIAFKTPSTTGSASESIYIKDITITEGL